MIKNLPNKFTSMPLYVEHWFLPVFGITLNKTFVLLNRQQN